MDGSFAGTPLTHPTDAAAIAENPTRLSRVSHLRRRNGRQNKRSAARVPPPRARFRLNGSWRADVDAAVVVMVSVEVTAVVPEIAAGWEAVHVGGSMAPIGLEVIAQINATAPVNPPLGVIVIVEEALIPGDATVADGPLSVKSAGNTMAKVTVVVSETPPELPVTVAV